MSLTSSRHSEPGSAVQAEGTNGRKAGALLLLTALMSAISAVSRVSADADQATLQESLDAISLHRGLYGMGGAARSVSGVMLVTAAWFLLHTWIIRRRPGSPLVPVLLAVSGAFTAISGLSALVLTAAAPDVSPFIEASELSRWFTGQIGFTAAGLALIIASRYQWKVGGTLRFIAPLSAILGAAMQFIWIDSATAVHPVVGAVFFLWLLAIGGMLFTGRTEKLFIRMVDSGH